MIKYDTFSCEKYEKKKENKKDKNWKKNLKTLPGPPLDDEHIKKVDALLIRWSIEMSVSNLQLKNSEI